ncbi:MAG: S4 domain-containing protein, partial [Rhodoplanes sp.]
MVRGSGGPRQPGGRRQIAGPRDQDRGGPKDRFASPPRSRGEGRGEGQIPSSRTRGTAPSPDRPRAAPAVDLSPQAGRGADHVQNVTVTSDEAGMRVDRFVEARFPGLSFSHIQRIIRKGEVRVNGKRVQPKDRLEAGQAVRVPPLK